MNDRPNREDALFNAALQLSTAGERAAYLERICQDDDQLRHRIEARLQAHERAGEALTQPLADISPTTLVITTATVPLVEKTGDRIGRYKLLQQIGEGGCGVVYMAEQEEPVRRRVALKVIKLGMDTKQVIARFEAERQALALMDHANIAKVLDAGTTEIGRPFFVMELVRGIKITDYCDQNNLTTEERLKLFSQVCHAIQHAHQKGIIHRDIKPANILVTLHDGVPVPKVIDFGIAKATTGQRLTDKTLFTAFEQFLGTPAYMSPEQAEMSSLDIDTRSDIYSLGVLLYELLIGKTPFDPQTLLKAGLDEMRRIIREQEPQPPSTRLSTLTDADLTVVAKHRQSEPPKLLNLIRGDLDWIVMKCLEKDRTRRYETANELAADLDRHLGSEPVAARPPSAAYRFKKALRRHRLFFAATGSVAAALLLGIVGSTWQAIRATQAERLQSALRQEAEHQKQQARENEERALNLLYSADMLAAEQAIERGRLERAQQLLNAHQPSPGQQDRRGFEWFHYSHLAKGAYSSVLLVQSNEFTRMAASSDGRMLALLDPEEIKAFDLMRRQVVQRWSRAGLQVRGIAISSDGRQIAAGTRNIGAGASKIRAGTTNDLLLFSTITGQRTGFPAGRYEVLCFAPDRPWIAGSAFQTLQDDQRVVHIWNYEQHRLLHSLTNAAGPLLWWETNSTILASINHSGALQRWEAATGKQLTMIEASASDRDRLPVSGAVADRSARGVIGFAGEGLSVFDPTDGRTLSESSYPNGVFRTPLAISADGNLFATSESGLIRLADSLDHRQYQIFPGHLEDVRGIAFIGSTSNLVSCGEDGRLLLWEPKPPLIIRFNDDTNNLVFGLESLELSADERYCAIYRKMWGLPRGDLIHSSPGRFVGFSPAGSGYATAEAGQLLVRYAADAGKESSAAFSLPIKLEESQALSLSRDGRFLACFQMTQTNISTLIFEARTGRLLANAAERLQRGSNAVFSLHGFLPNSHRLILSDLEGSAIWDWQAATNRALVTLGGQFKAISPDGRWMAVCDDSPRNLVIFAVDTNLATVKLEGHSDSIGAVAFSHDGRTLASVDSRGELRLWRLPQGQLVGIHQRRAHGFDSLLFSPDDQRLYLSDLSGVEVWEAPRTPDAARQPSSTPKGTLPVPLDSIWSRENQQ